MPGATSIEITDLLRSWQGDDEAAERRLLEEVLPTLRRLARREIDREGEAISLQATELVHELYLRLRQHRRAPWRERSQFFAATVQTARRILVERARRRRAQKRGSGCRHEELEETVASTGTERRDLDHLDEALNRLGAIDPTASRLVELRFFAGLTTREAAEVLSISRTTAIRRWQFARAYLAEALG